MIQKLASVALAALSLIGSANATQTSVVVSIPGTLTDSSAFTMPTRSVDVGDSFVDYYAFSVGGTSIDVFGAVASANVVYKNVVQKNVVFDKIELITPTTVNAGLPSEDPLPQFLFSKLTEGRYAIKVEGHAVGSQGGSYYGELMTASVPEPEAAMLVLAGLGVMGALARRRRN
jgi:hypothetical protein